MEADHPDVASSLTNLGVVAEAEGEYERARAYHERALAIRTAHEGDPRDLDDTRFALARALWNAAPAVGRDRPRARELAELAAAGYEAAGDKSSTSLAEVREWLATHVP